MTKKLVIFTDLDGCLLNKSDYDWSASRPMLQQLRQSRIPVVLNSSKTPAEMSLLAKDFGLSEWPFISENGGVIQWNKLRPQTPDARSILGVPRSKILLLLGRLHSEFQFRSFVNLGIDGVMEATDLARDAAARASDRQSTEPLLWDDSDSAIEEFRAAIEEAELTLTKGGRFWHITGKNSKGAAMQQVAAEFQAQDPAAQIVTAGIGDSQIDQSMLDVADYPIGIPATGSLNVTVRGEQGIIATQEGSAGWAEAVGKLLQLQAADNQAND